MKYLILLLLLLPFASAYTLESGAYLTAENLTIQANGINFSLATINDKNITIDGLTYKSNNASINITLLQLSGTLNYSITSSATTQANISFTPIGERNIYQNDIRIATNKTSAVFSLSTTPVIVELLNNTIPTAIDVVLRPDEPSLEELTGIYTYNDIDGDSEGTTTFKWFRNGVELTGKTTIRLYPEDFNVGDRIIFQVTPNDGKENGNPVNSSSSIIVPLTIGGGASGYTPITLATDEELCDIKIRPEVLYINDNEKTQIIELENSGTEKKKLFVRIDQAEGFNGISDLELSDSLISLDAGETLTTSITYVTPVLGNNLIDTKMQTEIEIEGCDTITVPIEIRLSEDKNWKSILNNFKESMSEPIHPKIPLFSSLYLYIFIFICCILLFSDWWTESIGKFISATGFSVIMTAFFGWLIIYGIRAIL